MIKRLIASLVCLTFSFSNLQYVQAQDFSVNQLPVPGTMIGKSAPFAPLALKGLIVNPQKPLEFQFIVDTGKGPQDTVSVKDQANQLVKYFLAGLTIPEGDLWVNLSPYEKNRMVPEALGQTDLGRDLLAQDYILKQLTASLIYPEKDLGKEFWNRVYAKAQVQFGTTNVPVNTFNKVWILPDQAQVFENVNAAYVTKSTLKVMLDEDYLAKQKHQTTQSSSISSQIVREIVIPEITKEVNTGKNFAPLRQIYQALILAKWYKETIQNGLLDALYTNKNKVAGVNLNDPTVKEQIYNRYLEAYKKGAFNYIKEDLTPDGQVVPRKYFSGGISKLEPAEVDAKGSPAMISSDGAMISLTVALVAAGVVMGYGIKQLSIFSAIQRLGKDDYAITLKNGWLIKRPSKEAEKALLNYGRTAVPMLIKALQSNYPNGIKYKITEILGEIGDKKAIPVLIEGLRNRNSILNGISAEALGYIGDAQASPALIDILRTRKHDYTELIPNVAIALGRIKENRAISELIKLVSNKDNDLDVRKGAAFALGEMKVIESVPVLINCLQEDRNYGKGHIFLIWVIHALQDISDKRAIPILRELSHYPSSDVRFSANFALKVLYSNPAMSVPTVQKPDAAMTTRREQMIQAFSKYRFNFVTVLTPDIHLAIKKLEKNMLPRQMSENSLKRFLTTQGVKILVVTDPALNEIVGYAFGLPQSSVPMNSELDNQYLKESFYVMSRQVLPEYQGQGIGSAMRFKLIVEAIKDGYKYFASNQVDHFTENDLNAEMQSLYGLKGRLILLKRGLSFNQQYLVFRLPDSAMSVPQKDAAMLITAKARLNWILNHNTGEQLTAKLKTFLGGIKGRIWGFVDKDTLIKCLTILGDSGRAEAISPIVDYFEGLRDRVYWIGDEEEVREVALNEIEKIAKYNNIEYEIALMGLKSKYYKFVNWAMEKLWQYAKGDPKKEYELGLIGLRSNFPAVVAWAIEMIEKSGELIDSQKRDEVGLVGIRNRYSNARKWAVEILKNSKKYGDVIKELLSRNPREGDDVLDFLQSAVDFRKEGYDFKIIYQPTSYHEEWCEPTDADIASSQDANSNSHATGQWVEVIDNPEVFEIERGGKLTDSAMNGGIDLSQINVLRNGKTVKVQFDPAQLIQLQHGVFKGFTPVIINMTPIQSPLSLLGISPSKEQVVLAKV